MPLGFSPLASAPSGASALPTPTIVTSGGVTVPVLGLQLETAVGTVTASTGGRSVLSGFQASGVLGQFGVITPNMTTVFLNGLQATAGIGIAQPASPVEVVLDGLAATGVQAPISYIAVGTAIAPSVEASGVLGSVTAQTPDRWIEIEPVSEPGWAPVSVLN